MRSALVTLILLAAPAAVAQTVVEMDLDSARQLLSDQGFDPAFELLATLSNNYKQHTNIRVHSKQQKKELALLAKALRTDFDGSGSAYVRDLTIWSIFNQVGGRTYLAASLVDPEAVLMTNHIDYLKGMVAFEILFALRQGQINLDDARRRALGMGIEMQVDETESGERTISFFGHGESGDTLAGKLVVIEPPDFVW